MLVELANGGIVQHMDVRVFHDSAVLADALARRLREALHEGPSHAVMLAGGRTPLAAYSRLAEVGGVGPNPAYAFLSDERHVPSESPESNQGTILPRLSAAGLPSERFVTVHTASTLEEAAAEFSADLDAMLSRGVRVSLGVLGIGADGHTASLFSLHDVARATESGRWAVPVLRPAPPQRISTTPLLFQRIDLLLFIVTGAEKAEIIARLIANPSSLPAGAATLGHPAVELWLDRDAASRI